MFLDNSKEKGPQPYNRNWILPRTNLETWEGDSLPEHPDETPGSQFFDFRIGWHEAEKSVETT